MPLLRLHSGRIFSAVSTSSPWLNAEVTSSCERILSACAQCSSQTTPGWSTTSSRVNEESSGTDYWGWARRREHKQRWSKMCFEQIERWWFRGQCSHTAWCWQSRPLWHPKAWFLSVSYRHNVSTPCDTVTLWHWRPHTTGRWPPFSWASAAIVVIAVWPKKPALLSFLQLTSCM